MTGFLIFIHALVKFADLISIADFSDLVIEIIKGIPA